MSSQLVSPRREDARAPSEKSSAPWNWAAVLVAGALLIAPVWLAPAPVTTDGPSHLYNAAVAAALHDAQPPYTDVLALDAGPAPNRAASTILTALGGAIGWSAAESLMLTAILLGSLLLFVRLASHAGASALNVAIAAWLAQHWFAWAGFFDFSLSVLAFAALLLTLQWPSGLKRDVAILLLAPLLAWSHVFTLAIAVALLVAHALLSPTRPRALLTATPPALLLLLLLAAGSTGGAALQWGEKAKAAAGLLIGDFVVTFHPLDLIAGMLIMAAAWLTLRGEVLRWRGRRLLEWPAMSVFACFLLVLSLIGPDGVGEGSYISARLRFLGVLCLLPQIGRALAGLSATARQVGFATLASLLLAHSAVAVFKSNGVGRDLAAVEQLLDSAGADAGDGIQSALDDHERGLFRVSGYAHIAARSALWRRLIVLDNYEAALSIFPVRWLNRPEYLLARHGNGRLALSTAPGARRERPIHLLHEAATRVTATDPALLLTTRTTGPFALTTVRRQ